MKTELAKLKWVVVDGLPFKLLHKYLKPDSMPNLADMVLLNKVTSLEPLYPNCQTPPSLFSIWSGCAANHHGILGYDTPSQIQPGSFHNGFTLWPDNIDMVWDLYAKAGLKVRLNHVPFVNEAKLGGNLVARSSIYENFLYGSTAVPTTQVLEIPQFQLHIEFELLSPHQTRLKICHLTCVEYEVIEHEGFVDIELRNLDKQSITLMIANTEKGYMCCLLGKNQYQSSGVNKLQIGTPANAVFHHASLASQYRKGLLGNKLTQGGSGRAEQLFFKSLEKIHFSFTQELSNSFSYQDADLYVGYYPVIDLALHEILGLDNLSNSYDLVSGLFEQLLLWLDVLIARLKENLVDDEHLLLNSDHGMQSIEKTCYLNQYLADNDWLKFDGFGNINWSQTIVAYHPAENGTLVMNSNIEACVIVKVHQAILDFFKEFGLAGAKIDSLDFIEKQGVFDLSHFLFPPDGVRVKASPAKLYVKVSEKSGDHCGYSEHDGLKGVLLTHNINKKQTKLEIYDILKFVTEK